MTPRRTPRVPEHRVGLLPRQRGLVEAALLGVEPDGGLLDRQLLGRGQELVQRRVEQAHRDGQAVHGLEDGHEVLVLDQAQLLEGVGLLLGRLGQDHAAHHRQAVLAEEHVLGAAQADALGARACGRWPRRRRCRRWSARPGGPCGSRRPTTSTVAKAAGGLAAVSGTWPGHHDARAAVEGDPVALGEGHAPGAHRAVAQAEHLGADHRRLAPTPGHDGGVADQAAPGGEDALGGQHAVHVLGRGLVAHQDDLLAPLGRGGGVVGAEVDLPDRRARAGPEALGPHRVARAGELGVEHRVEVVLGDAGHRLGLGDAEVARAAPCRPPSSGRPRRCACPPGSGASRACPARW